MKTSKVSLEVLSYGEHRNVPSQDWAVLGSWAGDSEGESNCLDNENHAMDVR
jgi:hypothetical protein